MTAIDILLVIVALAFAIPWVVYQSVKLATYAFYRGRQLFEDHNKHKESKNGP